MTKDISRRGLFRRFGAAAAGGAAVAIAGPVAAEKSGESTDVVDVTVGGQEVPELVRSYASEHTASATITADDTVSIQWPPLTDSARKELSEFYRRQSIKKE